MTVFHDGLGSLSDPHALHDPIDPGDSDPSVLVAQLRTMILIRRAEEIIGRGVERKEIGGPAHLGIGQEAVAVGVSSTLRDNDRIFGAHRSHTHYLAAGGDVYALFAEILGRDDGCSRGMGGSMHLHSATRGIMGTVPIVAGTIPLAVGAAIAAKKDGSNAIAVAYFGDGACEEGALHESLNLAAVWELPVLFVCENNLFSSHMHIRLRQPSNVVARFAEAHRISHETVDGNDVVAVARAAGRLVDQARTSAAPGFLEAVTYRWRGHVGPREDEDVGVNRGKELSDWKLRDPVERLTRALEERGHLGRDELRAFDEETMQYLEKEWARALDAAHPPSEALLDRVYCQSSS